MKKRKQKGAINLGFALFGLAVAIGTVALIYYVVTDGGENQPMTDLQDVLEGDGVHNQDDDPYCDQPGIDC